MNRISRILLTLSLILLAFSILPYTIAVFVEIPPVADFTDILVILPSFFFSSWILYEQFSERWQGGRWIRYLFLLSMLIFVEGHGIHWAANQIHNHLAPGDPGFEVAYFLDENLGHIMIFSGILLLLFTLSFMRIGALDERRRGDTLVLYFSSIVFGLYLSIGSIEGQVVYMVLAATIAEIVWVVNFIKHGKMKLGDTWVLFYLLTGIWTILFSLAYFLIVGSFTQPSELLGI